jgi:glycosyltransferase involved in cell wall biosynthesis
MLQRYYTNGIKEDDPRGHEVSVRTFGLLRYTPIRFSPAWKSYVINELYDRNVASLLEEPMERFMGFTGKSLRSFKRADELGFDTLELVAPNSHVENVYHLHEMARRQTGISDSWLNRMQVRKTLREYERADVIYVHSDYTADSLVEAGIPPEKLERTHLAIDARFQPPERRPDDGVFRIAYVGRVDATKGIPLLVEAFAELSADNAELHIVGGWSTGSMRRYMEAQMDQDPRIRVAPGDPLPVLQQADVFVHPTYEDGFGYAPTEALACGVPVIATEDTGMKEYIIDGTNGFVVPTGDLDAIIDRLHHVADHPLARTYDLTPASQAASAN